uniref:Protein deacetylase HDAC6 n=1 Tax=Myripristis murdjan TaxID=586833 RepID=A0A667ZSV4_9TELE
QPREATEEELLLVHRQQYVDLMRSTQTMTETELQRLSERYDSIYLHPESFQVASLAVGSVLQLVDKVVTSELRNGFAVVRPPGHHAQSDQANGFCLFNNVAVAARYAQRRHGLHRVLIVDWDVHHGQGVQYLFQDDPSVLYLSVHRYESGRFWPHLSDSDRQAVGSGRGEGFTCNLPWDQVRSPLHLLLSTCPSLYTPCTSSSCTSLSCQAAGEMCVTPQCFSVLTHMLMSLAEGRLILALEGGYNLRSTAEGAAACVRSLLGEACPHLRPPTAPSDSRFTSCFLFPVSCAEGGPLADGEIRRVTANEVRPSGAMVTGLVYDERMMEHLNMWDSHHPEQPQRISRIFAKHQELGLVDRCQRIPARPATEEELAMCHSVEHIAQMKATEVMKPRDLHRLSEEFNSVFLSAQSFQSAALAAGSCCSAARRVLSGQVNNAVAMVRPPGHHAERDSACGFCLFNTAALAARYAQSISHNAPLRVLILDWDVHHGNGTQHMFEDDDSVLYISLHRYDNGTFFPSSEEAGSDRVGVGRGAGFNVNVAWNGGRMGDSDYIAAFHRVVMPIATEFDPGLVVISAGFDAARGDPLGGYHVTPEGYAHLTHMLMSLAGGRVLLILEGGYNLTSISESMAMCTSVLLGDAPPSLATPLPPPHHCAVATINDVIRHHAPYWKSLRIHTSWETEFQRKRQEVRPAQLRQTTAAPRRPGGQQQGNPVCPLLVFVFVFVCVCQSDSSPWCLCSCQDGGVEQLAQGLASLDITQTTSANPTPSSTPVGGARQKVRPSPPKSSSEVEVKAESDGVTTLVSPGATHLSVCLSVYLSVSQSAMYVVDPLPWCPHLDAVKPLPPAGIDVFLPCQDCGSDAENWTCLTCYQVYCGRYINEHMVTHGVVAEHPIVLSFADLSVWCYLCEAYIHNKVPVPHPQVSLGVGAPPRSRPHGSLGEEDTSYSNK